MPRPMPMPANEGPVRSAGSHIIPDLLAAVGTALPVGFWSMPVLVGV